MSRMFKSVTRTWPVFIGCDFSCSYCNARKLALTRLKHNPRYKDGFKPRFCPEVLNWTFRLGEFIFVAYMGDIAFATREEFLRILARIMEFPETKFLIQTKNPRQIYDWWLDWDIFLPANVVLGTTIETNRNYGLTKAPPPIDRFRHIVGHPHARKFLSIEPICDFDLDILVSWVRIIKPEIVEVGYDNYGNQLQEPELAKTEALIARLEKFSIVFRKTIRKAWNE